MGQDPQRRVRLIGNKGVPEGKAWVFCSHSMGNTYHDIKSGLCQGCVNREARNGAAKRVSNVGN